MKKIITHCNLWTPQHTQYNT